MDSADVAKIKTYGSVVGSGGIALQIEMVSLMALAMMRDKANYSKQIDKLCDYILCNRINGSFYSTQSTVLALKALSNNSLPHNNKGIYSEIFCTINNRAPISNKCNENINEIVIYFIKLNENETKNITFNLKAEYKGIYNMPPSCAYLYYTSELKNWCRGEKIFIN